MRILYSHRTRSADGQRVHIDALTRALAARGHEVLIVGPEGSRHVAGEGAGEETVLDAGAGGAPPGLPRLVHEAAEVAYGALAAARLIRAGRGFEPDVLYERYNLYHHAGQAARRTLGVPWLMEVNAPLVEERIAHGPSGAGGLALPRIARVSEDRLWRAADAVLPVTRVLADMIKARGAPPDRLHVVPNAVDRTERARGRDAVRARLGLTDRFVLGFTGFVRDWHGVDAALRWLPGREDAVLLLVGDGPHADALRRQAEAMGVADRLIVTGVVQRDAIPDHVAAFDVALQPAATAYASPLKLQEYMVEARAIVGPAQPNISETVTNGQSALLVPPGDEAALHAALTRLHEDEALRVRLGEAARAVIFERDMTWDGNAARVERVAEALLG